MKFVVVLLFLTMYHRIKAHSKKDAAFLQI